MAFCPECGREYSRQVVVCRDCRVPLGSEPPASRSPVPLRWTRLCAISGLVEGSMLKGALESQGIHPRLVSYDLPAYAGVQVDWSRKGWGEIRVPSDEEGEARLILEDFVRAVSRLELEPAEPDAPDDDAPDPDDLSDPA